jgi:DNA-binding ferritin-like protein
MDLAAGCGVPRVGYEERLGSRTGGFRAHLAELLADNRRLVQELRSAHDACDRGGDVATASLIESWIDEAEGRAWFLLEVLRAS